MSNDAPKPILLVDGRNLMYRAIFANKNGKGYSKAHHFVVMLRFMWGWLDKFQPCAVNVFWDAPRKSVWRRKVFPGYKNRDGKKYRDDIKDDLIITQAAARAIFAHMGVRQYKKKGMEADDLIYSACRVLSPSPIIICSSDKDYEQIVFRMTNVRHYDPMKEKFTGAPDYDPALAKALAGDTSDTIDGYEGIGPVKSGKLARSVTDLEEFLEARGKEPYIRNRLLVDMALCPYLLKNDLYVRKVLASHTSFDKKVIMAEGKKHRVGGLASEFSRIVGPFKLLLENDQK